EELNIMFRLFFMNALVDAFGSHISKPDSNGLAYQVVKQYLPDQVTTIETLYGEKASARAGRVKKRIELLQVQKKKLAAPKESTGSSPKKVAAKKAAPKKAAKSRVEDDDEFNEED
ncbi:MAG: hypothetical protein JWQ30_2390, partial [Sediminibacterium sp.]|nr:hypothetical protein [Sediminibacterium sp.]